MIAWEYKMTQTWKKVDDLGEKGWELVGVGQIDTGFVYFLKRPTGKHLLDDVKPMPLQIEDEFGTYNFGDNNE